VYLSVQKLVGGDIIVVLGLPSAVRQSDAAPAMCHIYDRENLFLDLRQSFLQVIYSSLVLYYPENLRTYKQTKKPAIRYGNKKKNRTHFCNPTLVSSLCSKQAEWGLPPLSAYP
jgi:hypothetical protein